jgi:hypothetical protein
MWGRISGSVIGYLLFGPAGIFVGHLIGIGSEELLKEIFPDLPEKVAGAVGDTISDLVNEQFKKTKEALDKLESTERQQIGYELQTAFRDALCEALYDVGGEKCFKKEWRNKRVVPPGVTYPLTSQGNQLWQKKSPLAEQVCWCLDAMVKAVKAQQLLPLEPPADKPGAMVSSYLNAETPRTLNEAFFTQVIAPYLNQYKALLDELPDFKQHLHSYLLDRTLAHLGDLLKQRPEVWRTFLRLMLEDLRTGMRQLGIGQQETLKRLDELLDKSKGVITLADFGKAVADLMAAIGNIEKHQDEHFDVLMAQVVNQHGEVIDHLNEKLAGIKRVEYRLTEVGVDVEGINKSMKEILEYVRGASQEFTAQADRLIVKGRVISVMLRERQANYLERHRLFAGRSKEMEDICDFLHKQQQGYIFVTGLSGYGKTALLANLISQARERYVWYFLNQLDNTHRRKGFLRQMCEQLLAYYQVPVQREADLPEEEDRLEALYSKLLRMPLVQTGQLLILVIDGVDEAEDNFINDLYIPSNLPDGKFIIFSARQVEQEESDLKQDYPTKLGLPEDKLLSIELKALDRAGIETLLREAGGNAITWADDSMKLDQVERVSEGDPFYIRYLIEDIAKRRITLEQIEQMPKGVDNYLDGWWSQVVKAMGNKNLQNLMGILMVAVGPFPCDDLFHLYPKMEWTFDKLLKRVRRFVFTSKVVSREKGEQVTYTLCHWRFRDYIAQKKLPGKVAMYQEQLLDYCARWQDHHSLYALQFFSIHLLKLGRFREVLSLVDGPFLREKIRHLQSYTSVLTDFKNAMHAAATLHDRAKLLGLALAYNGLQEKAVQLADSKVVPLYARFGKPELALELTRMISDETKRAKTRIAVAKELLSSNPELAQELIRQILVNWQRYPEGDKQADILAQVFALLPEELVPFLENLDDFSPIYSLAYFIKQDAPIYGRASFYQIMARLDPSLQERVRGVLTRALSSEDTWVDKSDLRFMLVLLEADPTKAVSFAESEAAQIIVQARRERLEPSTGSLKEQTVDQTIRLFLDDLQRPTSYEQWALLHLVIVPHAEQFLTAIRKMDAEILVKEGDEVKVTRKMELLSYISKALADEHDVAEAKKFLYECLQTRKEVAQLLKKPTSEVYAYDDAIWSVQEISESLAAENLQAALDFLKSPEILQLRQEDWSTSVSIVNMYSILRAAARANPEAALPIVEREWHDQAWAWDIIAQELVRVELELALNIWHEHTPEEEKSVTLINMLYNAPSDKYQRALEVVEQDLTLDSPYQLYKVPVLLDIALRLKQDQPESAKTIALNAIDHFRQQFEKEGWGRLRQELFLVRIISAVAACSPDLIQAAEDIVRRVITDDHGLKLLAAADLLSLLARRRDVPGLREKFRQFHEGRVESALPTRKYPPLTDQTVSSLNSLIARNSLIASREGYGGGPSGKRFEVLVAFVEWLNKTSRGQLINLYLLHHARKETLDLRPDYIKALLVIKTFPFYYTDVLHYVKMVEDDEVRQLTFIDLYHKLPLRMIAQQYNFIRPALDAIAWVRVTARERNLQKKQQWFDAAFKAAERSFKDLQEDDFTLDLLFQFVREVRQLDSEHAAEQADQFAKRVIEEVLKTRREWFKGWEVERLFELGDCGYHFSKDQCMAIEQESDQSLYEWEKRADSLSAHPHLAKLLISMAQSTMYVNRDRSLTFIERAVRHANLITEQTSRRFRQQRILRFLLECEEASLWEQAAWRSLDFGDAIFETFDLFGSKLLKMEQQDKELPLRLKEVIDWAEQLWRI